MATLKIKKVDFTKRDEIYCPRLEWTSEVLIGQMKIETRCGLVLRDRETFCGPEYYELDGVHWKQTTSLADFLRTAGDLRDMVMAID